MDLTELIPRLRQADELAWEAFVLAYQGRLFGLAYHYVGNAEDARDLAQEAFVRIYRNLAQLPGADAVLPWALAITRNACLDFFRRRQARPPAWDLPAEQLGLADPEADPEAALLARGRREAVHRALRQLTGLNREMILLKEIHGLSVETIAGILDVPEGTVKSRASRARLELAGILAAEAL